MLLIKRFSGPVSLLLTLDLMSDDHATGYADIFWREKIKTYNLILVKWKILYIFTNLYGFWGREVYWRSLSDDRVTGYAAVFVGGNMEILYVNL